MQISDVRSPQIVIAGASGYIGKALIPQLLNKYPTAKITALSRSQQHSNDPRVVWKACDLFSIESIENSMPERADLGFYLVHSMGPTAHFDQGSFADYDLILADNFARAVEKMHLKQVIYLGGLIPSATHLSLHLQSRLEVEETFAQFKLPLTIFRAGLILGEAGSSFQILVKLVKRLPVMICPKWTQTLTTPVDLQTVLNSMTEAALDESHIGKIYDLAGCQTLTYLQMMKETARQMGKRRAFFSVPFFTPTLSRLWVSLITNTPKNLVYPLIESLEHEMVARQEHMFSNNHAQRSYSDLLKNANFNTIAARSLFRFQAQRKTVRSVQRLPIPAHRNAEWAKEQYLVWLPKFLAPLIRVSTVGNRIVFSALLKRWDFLELEPDLQRSQKDWQQLSIVKGFLVAEGNNGRLEFRQVLNNRFLLAAIHDYKPALPWYIYVFTQAKLHLLVMKAFGRFLGKDIN